MNYLRRSNLERGSRNFIPILVVVIFFGIIFSIQAIAPGFLSDTFGTIAFPIWRIRSSISGTVTNIFDIFQSKQNLITRNKALDEELASLKISLEDKEMLARENVVLRQMIGRNESSHPKLAEVLVRPPQSAYDNLILDLGKRDGINVGDKIIYPPNVILGEITETNLFTSKAKLLSSAGNMTNIVLDRKNISASVLGLGSGNFEVKLPREISIENGDLAIIPGSSHLILGSVEDIEFGATDSLERILIKSPINIAEVRWVFIESYPI